jgi:hypothetical protein
VAITQGGKVAEGEMDNGRWTMDDGNTHDNQTEITERGGVGSGDDDDDNNGGGGSGDNDDNSRCGGREGHHWMRKGRQHDNRTTHNNQLDHGRGRRDSGSYNDDGNNDNDNSNKAMKQTWLQWWQVARGKRQAVAISGAIR